MGHPLSRCPRQGLGDLTQRDQQRTRSSPGRVLLSTISERRGGLCAPIILVTMQNRRRRSCQRQDEPGRERGSGCISVLGCHHVDAFQNSASATEGETLPRFTAVEPGNLLLPSQT